MNRPPPPGRTVPAKGGLGLWDRWGTLAYGLLLAAGTLWVYGRVVSFEFTNFDDPVYVTENPHVRAGLTWAGLHWAWTAIDAANWHPLTWLSHMLDCQCYGLRAGGHHLTSLLLHLANALLVFALLLRLTRQRGRSFLVAALFAWHPLHVESVAWVAERKDVLSTCFGLLSLFAYVQYVRRLEERSSSPQLQVPSPRQAPNSKSKPASTHHAPRTTFYYLLALVLFALGLMSKPMLVTLPFVLLLLDYWPLARWEFRSQNRPTLGAKAFSLQPSAFGLLLEKLPFFLLSAACCGMTLWAQGKGGAILSVATLPLGNRLANAVLSYGWYLRQTVWPEHLAVLYPLGHPGLNGAVVLTAAALAGLTASALWLRRAPYLTVGWLWFLGTLVPVIGLVQVGEQARADRYMYLPMLGLLISLCWAAGELGRRRPQWVAGLAVLAMAACLGTTWRQLPCWQNSVALFKRAVAVTHDNYIVEENLGIALARHGAMAPAWAHLQTALRLRPDRARIHCNLALWLSLNGQPAQAVDQYREALRLQPNYPVVQNNLAWLLATHPDDRLRNGPEALKWAQRATAAVGHPDAGSLDTLAAAYAEVHQFAEAVQVAERAVALARAAGQDQLAQQIQARLARYHAQQPYREP